MTLSHVWNLKLKLKQEELAHLLEDYESAAEQLNYTLDEVERNRLKRRLTALEIQAQTVEHELHELKQTDPHPCQQLRDLLEQHAPNMGTALSLAYRACGLAGPMPQEVETLLAALANAPQGLASHAVIDQFVAHLVCDRQLPESVHVALRQYGAAQIAGFSELLAALAPAPAGSTDQDDPAYVMVKLRLSQQDSTRVVTGENRYFVDVWVIPRWSQYDAETGLGCDRLDLPELMEQTYSLSELPQILEDCLIECAEVCQADPLIELFFPLDLLNTPLENWVIEGDLQPICSQNSMVVRSSDRLTRRYRRRRAQWKQRWDALTQHGTLSTALVTANCHQCGLDASACGDQVEMDLIKAFGLDPSLVGLKFTLTCSNRDPYDLFNVMLQLGIPVALWVRHSMSSTTPPCDYLARLDTVLNGPWQQIQERVRRQRLKAIGQPDHLGQHLSLLWENPYRLPPDIDYAY